MSRFRFPHLIATWLFLGCLVASSSADAQLVRVGPLGGVNIRLPFVSVDTLPFGGGTRVRAPFTSVNTGLYGFGGPVYGPRVGAYIPRGYQVYPEPFVYADPFIEVVPVFPVPVDPVLVPVPVYPTPHVYHDDRSDRPEVYGSTLRPRYNDSYRTTRPNLGAARPGPHGSLYQAPDYPSPASQAPASQTPAFQAPGDSAAETSLRLRQAAARLDRALGDRADDADVWRDYLAPQEIVSMIDGAAALDINRMTTLQRNYEGVAGNPDLSDIWVLDGFRRTHAGLKSWLSIQGVKSDRDQVVPSNPSAATAPSSDATRSGERVVEDDANSPATIEDLPPGMEEPEPAPLASDPEPFDAPDRVEGEL